jgi:aminoglycoside phosphotransferase (APT) family kinase protein
MTMRFAYAQLTTAAGSPSKDALAEAIRLASLKKEIGEHAKALQKEFDAVAERLQTYPSVVTHGDLNPSNMYPQGVIDLEDSFEGPLGFDVVSVLMTQEWFPDGAYEFVSKYRMSEAQKFQCIAQCDALYARAGFPPLSHAYRDLSFCRAVWLCAGMNEWPNIQKWRFEKFKKEFLHE